MQVSRGFILFLLFVGSFSNAQKIIPFNHELYDQLYVDDKGNDTSLYSTFKTMNYGDYNTDQDTKNWIVQPLADFQLSNSDALNFWGAGIILHGELAENWNLYSSYRINVSPTQPITSLNHSNSQQDRFVSHLPEAILQYEPVKWGRIEAGIAKHFIGDGYRSMFLSDVSEAHPFLRLNAKVWRIKYDFMVYSPANSTAGTQRTYFDKYIASHYFNVKITKRWSIGIFESVVWQAQDTLVNRGFDFNYLNPVVFFRPVEYSLGSSDNALLGIDSKVRIGKKSYLYGQFLLDEFLLKEIQADIKHFIKPNSGGNYGWWANKYAWQLGLKWFTPFDVKNLMVQVEYNGARPFTYTHQSVLQNYGSYNTSLAHPLQANFKEVLFRLHYTYKSYFIQNTLLTYIHGEDKDPLNYGGSISTPYANRAKEYQNTIGQGVQRKEIINQFEVGRKFKNYQNVKIKLGVQYRKINSENPLSVYVGITSDLWNRYTDY